VLHLGANALEHCEADIGAGVNLNPLFLRISFLRNRARPSWHGSGYPLS